MGEQFKQGLIRPKVIKQLVISKLELVMVEQLRLVMVKQLKLVIKQLRLVIKQLRLVIKQLRLVVKLLVKLQLIRLVRLINEQLIFQLDNIQLFLNIYQLGRILI